jgi:tRNA (guanine37-N1)-methyltransferase
VKFDIVTIFPRMVAAGVAEGIVSRGIERGLVDVSVHDLRDYASDRHRSVDDQPYGGGPGMVMRPEPWGAALDAVLAAGRRGFGDPAAAPLLLVPTPSGVPFTQRCAVRLATEQWLAFACGRYEGIDERVLEDAARRMPVVPLSLGDYVLGGGEVAALAVVEAVSRLLPGVVGNPDSLVEESHAGGLLECPVYTRPASWRGRDVPSVLTGGDHAAVARWRRDAALRRTAERRPDLLAALDPATLDAADLAVLEGLGWAVVSGRLVRRS